MKAIKYQCKNCISFVDNSCTLVKGIEYGNYTKHCNHFEPNFLNCFDRGLPQVKELNDQLRRLEILEGLNYDKHKKIYNKLLDDCTIFENQYC